MAFNPCPCMSVGKGVKVLALVDAILAALFVVGLTVLLALVALHPPHQHDIKVITIVTFTFYLVFNLSEIALAMILLSAAKNQNTKKCNIWLVVTCIMVGLTMLGLLSQIVQLRAGIEFIFLMNWIPFKIYEWVVVYSFVQYVTEGEKGNGIVYPTSETRLLEPDHSRYVQSPSAQ